MKTRSPAAPQVAIIEAAPVKKKSKGALLKAALDASFAHVCALPVPETRDGETRVFVLPLSPLSINSRLYWRIEDTVKKQYKECFLALQIRDRLPLLPRTPWESATATATIYTKRALDDDNAMSKTKQSLDLIVRAGFLKDDKRADFRWAALHEQVVDGKSPAYLVIRLTPAKEEEL